MKNRWLLPVLILISFVSCTPDKDELAVKELHSLFSTVWEKDQPGAVVLVLKKDSVVFEKAYGLATIRPNTPAQPGTFFCIASVSKQFSAVAIMQLAEEGKLSLDDPVSMYFPQFKADFFKQITLRHLLSHTSGIPDVRPRTDSFYVYHSADVESYSYLDTLSFLNFQPGTHYEYMNPTFQLMYTIIEKASGIPFEEYMHTRIFLPAGMKESVYFEEGRTIPEMSHGYEWNKISGQWEECDYGETSFFATKADGGLYTSVREFVQWEKALRNNLFISPQMTREAHSPKIATDIPYTGYGYGWFIEERPGFTKRVYHTGDNGGYQIYAGRYPEKELLFLIFSTRNISRESTVEKAEQIMQQAEWL